MTTQTIYVNASNNDGYEVASNGAVTYTATTLGNNGAGQWIGIRFTGLTIPKGVLINSAYLSWYVQSSKYDDWNVTIYGQKSISPAVISATTNNITSRTRTTASAGWVVTNEGGTSWAQSPDLSSIFQEIVNQSTWTPSSRAVFLIIDATAGGNNFLVNSYDQSTTLCPRLDITYNEIQPSGIAVPVTVGVPTISVGVLPRIIAPPSIAVPVNVGVPTVTSGNITLPLESNHSCRVIIGGGPVVATVETPIPAQSVTVFSATGTAFITNPVADPGAPSITTASLPHATKGQSYGATLAATGGTQPLTWSATGLPAGLSISGSGISGSTSVAAGTYSVTITVTDSHAPARTNSVTLPLVVDNPALISTTTDLAISANPITNQDITTLTATVSPNPASGTVDFFVGSTNVGTVSVDVNGNAALDVGPLATASYTYHAVYSGTSAYATSTSPNRTLTVNDPPVPSAGWSVGDVRW